MEPKVVAVNASLQPGGLIGLNLWTDDEHGSRVIRQVALSPAEAREVAESLIVKANLAEGK